LDARRLAVTLTFEPSFNVVPNSTVAAGTYPARYKTMTAGRLRGHLHRHQPALHAGRSQPQRSVQQGISTLTGAVHFAWDHAGTITRMLSLLFYLDVAPDQHMQLPTRVKQRLRTHLEVR
jgi:hypothetical protein